MAQKSNKEVKKEREKASRKAAYVGSLIGLAVVGIIGIIIWTVNFTPNLTVLTVGDYEVKRDLYTCVYYYDTMASDNWADKYQYDLAKDPYKQSYEYYADGVKYDTWGDYFEKLTNDTLRLLIVMNDIADKNGYTYKEEVQDHIDAELASIEEEKGTTTSFKEYMLTNYGAPITKKVLVRYLELYYKGMDFYKAITESKALFNKYIGGNSSSFEKAYRENADEIDVVTFRYYFLAATKDNAAKIEALKHAGSEKEFKALCNRYAKDENYTKNDKSLYQNMSLQRINSLSKSEISKLLSSEKSKAGDIYAANGEMDGKTYTDIIYVVKARGKDTSAYKDSDVKQWEFKVMGILLEQFYDTNYHLEVSSKGMEVFKKSMIIPEDSIAQ